MEQKLSKLLAFNELVLGKTEDEMKSLATIHGIDYSEYSRRIRGKEKEYEFLYILDSLKVLKHLESFDEELSYITDEYTADFKVELRDGYKMLIEVKHTDKNRFQISTGNLNNRIDFANRQGLPLRFAVSINGLWGLFTADALIQNNGKLTYSDFVGRGSISCFESELDTCSYMFDKPIKIESIYSTNHNKGMGVKFEPYGELISYRFYYDDKLLFRAKGKESKYMTYVCLLEAIHDRISNINQNIKQDNNFTIITEYSNKDILQSITEYNFLLALVNHTLTNNPNVRNSPHLLISEKKHPLIDIRYLRASLYQLASMGLDFLISKDNYIYRFTDYARSHWMN